MRMMPVMLAASRRRAIRRLIRRHPIQSQTALVALLTSEGFPVTQATVSRDLKELGAVKARRDGRLVYVIDDSQTDGSEVASILDNYALRIEATGNLVVISTPPGAAQVVAGAVDRANLPGILGTVAGDDTLFIATEAGVPGRRVAAQLNEMGAP